MIFVLTNRYIVIQFTLVDEQYRRRVANDEANPLNWITTQQEVRDRRNLKPGIGPGFSFFCACAHPIRNIDPQGSVRMLQPPY
jgi:hypothetical protein